MSQGTTAMPTLPDYYEILQVHPKASQAVIKKAYRTLLLEMGHHPDQGGDPVVAAMITEAYQVLGDPARRSEYDHLYFGLPATSAPAAGARTAPAGAPAYAKPTTAGSSLVVLCPRCRTKNRVRSQEVLDIAKCSKCGQKLSRMPGLTAEVIETLRGEWDRALAAMREAAKKRPRTAADGRRPPKAIAVGVPLLLMAASGAAIAWTLTGDRLVGDPIQTADRLKHEKRYDEAEQVLSRAIGHDPANPVLHEKLGETYLKQKIYVGAIKHYGEAARLNPDNGYVQAQKARAQYLAGKLDDAERSYKRALTIDPNDDTALFDLGNIHAKRERYIEASHYYQRALRLQPSADLYYNLGFVQKQVNQRDQAIASFRASLRQDPNHRASMVQLAELYNERGQFELAAAQYLTASQLKHEDVDLHLRLATIYERTGQTRFAIREWNLCLAQGKDNPMIVERARRALTKLGAPPAS